MDFFEKIDAYLDGELTGSELSSFLEEMKHNPDLAKEVELFKNVNTLLNDKAEEESKRKYLEKLHREYMNTHNKKLKSSITPDTNPYSYHLRNFYYEATAGLTILLIAAGIYIFSWFGSNSNTELFAAYYSPYVYSGTTRGNCNDNSSTEDSFDKGLKQYEAANYSSAIPFFQNTLAEDSLKCGANFFIGICYMETKQYNKAITSFQKIVSSGGSNDYSESARWYLGLCYLENGNKLQALSQFRFLEVNSDYYKTKSLEILTRLEE